MCRDFELVSFVGFPEKYWRNEIRVGLFSVCVCLFIIVRCCKYILFDGCLSVFKHTLAYGSAFKWKMLIIFKDYGNIKFKFY